MKNFLQDCSSVCRTGPPVYEVLFLSIRQRYFCLKNNIVIWQLKDRNTGASIDGRC
jgi:hypothetical protein